MYDTDGQHTKYRGDLLPFDVVIIDEASQGSEAEVLAA
jgi:superfamily I DNA and/or RNA helicase